MNQHYVNCFSLGWFCGTASSLSRLGLRNSAGPFDWYYSHYWFVLKQIEDDFQDFMKKENLQVDKNNKIVFYDKKYGFICGHDIKENFEAEYDDIYKKYCRRVKVFRKAIVHPTVFFRCIRDQEEVDYINANYAYAENLLKSYNEKNRIVYLYHNGLEGITEKVQSINLNVNHYVFKTYEMRHLFENSESLLDLCDGLLADDLIQKNKDFDIRKNAQKSIAAYVNKCIEDQINGIDKWILNTMQATKDEGIYLWGAGKFGIPLAFYLKEQGISINGIIDKKVREIKGLNIVPFEEIEDEAKIFIAISNKEANEEIEQQILETYPKALIFKYQDLSKEISRDF